jgi:hypothetical protein
MHHINTIPPSRHLHGVTAKINIGELHGLQQALRWHVLPLTLKKPDEVSAAKPTPVVSPDNEHH